MGTSFFLLIAPQKIHASLAEMESSDEVYLGSALGLLSFTYGELKRIVCECMSRCVHLCAYIHICVCTGVCLCVFANIFVWRSEVNSGIFPLSC